jgi:hypothetical protein
LFFGFRRFFHTFSGRMLAVTMSDHRSDRAAKIQDSIRQILFQDWDPVSVGDNPNLRDEYDSYIAPVYRILTDSRSEQELVDYLFGTEREEMGMPCKSPEQLRAVARKLLELDVRL